MGWSLARMASGVVWRGRRETGEGRLSPVSMSAWTKAAGRVQAEEAGHGPCVVRNLRPRGRHRRMPTTLKGSGIRVAFGPKSPRWWRLPRNGRGRRSREAHRMNDPENRMLSRFGSDPEDIARGLREFSKSAEMLSNDQPRLIDEHPLQWIGVYRGEVSAKAGDLPSLMEELERRGIPPGDTIVRFIEKNRRTLIL